MAASLPVLPRPRFARSARSRLLTGVAGGLAERLEIDPWAARLLVVLLALAGGAGLVGYLLAWSVSTDPEEQAAPPPVNTRHTLAAAAATLAALLTLRGVGLWPGDAVMVPAMASALGGALLGSRLPASDRARARRAAIQAMFGARSWPLRLLVGGILALGGILLLAGAGTWDQVRQEARSVALALVGLTIVMGPWLGRLMEQLDQERRERIRSEERAAMAAHLHDSVLQTLTLIQRSADEPRRMVRLARHQERELRAWLYGDRHAMAGPESLARAVELVAEEVETNHDVRVEVVVVGDHVLDQPAEALLGAVREAAVNAARHAGVDSIAVYVEVEEEMLSAFVRDRGRGFDPDRVPADRHGIGDSIRGRVRRAGGEATLVTAPGAGTEVQMRVPVPHPAGAR
jgi:signal transduction histidine kinase